MAKEESNNSYSRYMFVLVAIVAIVAIVALFKIANSGQSSGLTANAADFTGNIIANAPLYPANSSNFSFSFSQATDDDGMTDLLVITLKANNNLKDVNYTWYRDNKFAESGNKSSYSFSVTKPNKDYSTNGGSYKVGLMVHNLSGMSEITQRTINWQCFSKSDCNAGELCSLTADKGYICVTEFNAAPKKTPVTATPTCIDPDNTNPLDEVAIDSSAYKKSTITGKNTTTNKIQTELDYCGYGYIGKTSYPGSQLLHEGVCITKDYFQFKLIVCPKGTTCSDGACTKLPEPQPVDKSSTAAPLNGQPTYLTSIQGLYNLYGADDPILNTSNCTGNLGMNEFTVPMKQTITYLLNTTKVQNSKSVSPPASYTSASYTQQQMTATSYCVKTKGVANYVYCDQNKQAHQVQLNCMKGCNKDYTACSAIPIGQKDGYCDDTHLCVTGLTCTAYRCG